MRKKDDQNFAENINRIDWNTIYFVAKIIFIIAMILPWLFIGYHPAKALAYKLQSTICNTEVRKSHKSYTTHEPEYIEVVYDSPKKDFKRDDYNKEYEFRKVYAPNPKYGHDPGKVYAKPQKIYTPNNNDKLVEDSELHKVYAPTSPIKANNAYG